MHELRAAGYRTGLVTNNVKEASGQWRVLVPVDELFEVIVDSSEVGMRKPNPAIYLHALDLLGGVRPESSGLPRRCARQRCRRPPRRARTASSWTPPTRPAALTELDSLLARS